MVWETSIRAEPVPEVEVPASALRVAAVPPLASSHQGRNRFGPVPPIVSNEGSWISFPCAVPAVGVGGGGVFVALGGGGVFVAVLVALGGGTVAVAVGVAVAGSGVFVAVFVAVGGGGVLVARAVGVAVLVAVAVAVGDGVAATWLTSATTTSSTQIEPVATPASRCRRAPGSSPAAVYVKVNCCQAVVRAAVEEKWTV